jgi:hypothetical protein
MSDLKVNSGEPLRASKYNRMIDRFSESSDPASRKRNQHNAIFQTPSGGIPGRSGTTMGEAECKRCFFAGNVIDVATGENDFVLNLSPTAVAGSKYIQCVWIDGRWVVNWEDCE